ncbi:hypothetical protein [Paenibacillus sp. y28]|uniref:hypothetical protein n=1 Tax=Paenibacillus sp. y28 TaxID=3129110 RepID=UPI00301A2BF5
MTNTAAVPKIHCGTFDAETLWRDERLAKLPALPDAQSGRIVQAMDELLFLFSRDQDVVLTRYPMNEAHVHYLRDLGFQFSCNRDPLAAGSPDSPAPDKRSDAASNIFHQLTASFEKLSGQSLIPAGAVLEPFAVIDGLDAVRKQYGLLCDAPSLEIMRQVNSKLYSTQLKDTLGIPNISSIVTSMEELEEVGNRLIAGGPFLIKDTFGVSGKGNLLIQTPSMLQRMLSYLRGQVTSGKELLFILEPLLDKRTDFSCQFYIGMNGSFHVLSVQQVLNTAFAYLGSVTASGELLEQLEAGGYFEIMRQTARQLHNSGYFGHVCVDSMLLADGEIVPLVEINARKSMSLLKRQVDLFLAGAGASCQLSHVSVIGGSGRASFEDVLYAMKRRGMLFDRSRERGIIPLSANTLTVNQDQAERCKGRLYVALVDPEAEGREQLLEQLKHLLQENAYHPAN